MSSRDDFRTRPGTHEIGVQESMILFESDGLEMETSFDFEDSAFDPIKPRLTALPGSNPNGIISPSPSSIFANIYSVSMYKDR